MALLKSDFLVRLHGTFMDSTYLYMLMEPVLGGELFDVYESLELFGNVEHCRFYIACVTLGLDHIHSCRIIYRDLKLENCLLGCNGYLKLTDFGLAKMVLGK